MTHRLKRAFARLLSEEPWKPPVHFHAGEGGRPYVCENPRCESPGL